MCQKHQRPVKYLHSINYENFFLYIIQENELTRCKFVGIPQENSKMLMEITFESFMLKALYLLRWFLGALTLMRASIKIEADVVF
jgi:hypothetical protein